LVCFTIGDVEGASVLRRTLTQRLGAEDAQFISMDIAVIRLSDRRRRQALIDDIAALDAAHSPALLTCFTLWAPARTTWSLTDAPPNYARIRAILNGEVEE